MCNRTRRVFFYASIDVGDFGSVTNIATGALEEFDVALFFHWELRTEKRTLPRYSGKYLRGIIMEPLQMTNYASDSTLFERIPVWNECVSGAEEKFVVISA